MRRLLLPLPITRLLFHLDKCDDELIGWGERSHHYFVTIYSSSSSTVTFKYLTKHFIPKSSSQVSISVFMLPPASSKLPLHLTGYFLSVSGYLEIDGDVFKGGQDFEISMEFRTDQLNSLLIFAYNKYTEDFMLVRSDQICRIFLFKVSLRKEEIVYFGCVFVGGN